MSMNFLSFTNYTLVIFRTVQPWGEGARDCAFTEVYADSNKDGWAARDETFKYISFENGEQRFYNLIDDPYEADDLLPNLSVTEQVSFDKLSNLFDVLSPVDDLEKEGLGFKIFPNPVREELFLEVENFTQPVQRPDGQYFYIFDIAGKRIMSGEINETNQTVSMGELNAGMYFIQVGEEVKKFVKR